MSLDLCRMFREFKKKKSRNQYNFVVFDFENCYHLVEYEF